MANIGYQGGKIKTKQAVYQLLMHCDKEERLMREHANENIQKALTKFNTQWAPPITDEDGTERQPTMQETYVRFTNRIDELDATTNTNKRKDRVMCCSLMVYPPVGLPEDKEDEWFKKAYDYLKDEFGEENVLGAYVHRDEIHEYIDSKTKTMRTSSAHMTVMGIPEINGKLKAAEFTSRKNIMKRNNYLDAMTRMDYGIQYMTGEGKRSNYSVDELKRQSEVEKAKMDAIAVGLAEGRARAQKELESKMKGLDAREQNLQVKEDLVEIKYKRIKADYEDKVKKVAELDKTLKNGEYEQQEMADELSRLIQQVNEKHKELEAIDIERIRQAAEAEGFEKGLAEAKETVDDALGNSLEYALKDLKDKHEQAMIRETAKTHKMTISERLNQVKTTKHPERRMPSGGEDPVSINENLIKNDDEMGI